MTNTNFTIGSKEYFAMERANARVMNTNIWQACKILGLDVNGAKPSVVFHNLFNMYLAEELEAAD